MRYNFKAARKLRDDLVFAYRKMKHLHEQDGSWEWWIEQQIEEIDREIGQAHAVKKAKLTAVNGQPVVNIENIYMPILPQWAAENKGVRA